MIKSEKCFKQRSSTYTVNLKPVSSQCALFLHTDMTAAGGARPISEVSFVYFDLYILRSTEAFMT